MKSTRTSSWDDGQKSRHAANEEHLRFAKLTEPFIEAAKILDQLNSPSLDTTTVDNPIALLNEAYSKHGDGRFSIPSDFDLMRLRESLLEIITKPPMEFRRAAQEFLGINVLQMADCSILIQSYESSGRLRSLGFYPLSDSRLVTLDGKHFVGIEVGDVPSSEIGNAIPLLTLTKLAQLGPTDVEILARHCHPGFITPNKYIRDTNWSGWDMGDIGAKGAKDSDPRGTIRGRMLRLLEDQVFSGARVCFAGCGGGEEIRDVLATFGQRANLSISGFDSSSSQIARAKTRVPQGTDLRCIKFEDAVKAYGESQFDFLVAVGVLDRLTLYFDEGVSALETFRHLLKPGGKAILLPEGPSLFTNAQIRRRGFDVLRSWDFKEIFGSPRPFHLVQRTDRTFSAITDPQAEDIRDWETEKNFEDRLNFPLKA